MIHYSRNTQFPLPISLLHPSSFDGFEKKDAPNWEKLEQDLRYFGNGALFGKALQTALPNPFSIFLKTLANGDRGVASQNSLAFAFSILGVEWTETEVEQLNSLLEQNNFTIRL